MSLEKTNSNEKDNIWGYSDEESEFDYVEPILESQAGKETELVEPIESQTDNEIELVEPIESQTDNEIECHNLEPIVESYYECPKQHTYKRSVDEFQCDYFVKSGDMDDKFKRRMFYIAYRTRQRISGAITGAIDGCATGMYIGGKWGGGGGWIMGGIMQLITIVVTPFIATPICAILGFMSDRYTVMQLIKDYRYSIAAGGMPPTHGSLE